MNLNNKIVILLMILISTNSYSGINDKQKTVIKSQLFLLNEGMLSKKDVFEKAKLFDNKGFFGMNSDVMTQEEFDNFLEKEERGTHH
tara:strand:+ start:162 stop:422 length:261 start_codon:yes stop_codon:yes gene_type:complete